MKPENTTPIAFGVRAMPILSNAMPIRVHVMPIRIHAMGIFWGDYCKFD